MTAAVAIPELAAPRAIALPELLAQADLLTRTDRKYAMTRTDLVAVLTALPDGARVLEIDGQRQFGYASVYFDTPDLRCYLGAARRRRRRFKVRTRVYTDSSEVWLEVKTRGARGATVKDRTRHETPDALGSGLDFVVRCLEAAGIDPTVTTSLAPVLVTRYRRATLALPEARARVTIDTDLRWSETARPRGLQRGELVVVETKTETTASSVDRLLWRHGHRPVRISKYATGLAALRPELPATPWSRTLRRLDPTDTRSTP